MRFLRGLIITLVGAIPLVALETTIDPLIHPEFARKLVNGILLGLLVGCALIASQPKGKAKKRR